MALERDTHDPHVKDSPEETASRPLLSLVLFIHLFIVFVCLAGNYSPSMVTARMLRLFSPYSMTFNLNPDMTPYHLTHASINDVDHRIEVLPAGASEEVSDAWIVLPDRGFRGDERYKRYQRLARTLNMFGENEQMAATIAQDVGTNMLAEGIEPYRLRARRHFLQHWEVFHDGNPEERDPYSDRYFGTTYRAALIVNQDGTVNVTRLGEVGRTAVTDVDQQQQDEP